MKILTTMVLVLPLTLGTVALSHAEETNPIIKQRMEAMKSMGASAGVLGKMAKGEMAFDAEAAQAAAANIAETAAEVPALFEANVTSPTSRALPAIWENYQDFSKEADTLSMTAEKATMVTAQADVGPALGAIGETCNSCHKDYRAEKK